VGAGRTHFDRIATPPSSPSRNARNAHRSRMSLGTRWPTRANHSRMSLPFPFTFSIPMGWYPKKQPRGVFIKLLREPHGPLDSKGPSDRSTPKSNHPNRNEHRSEAGWMGTTSHLGTNSPWARPYPPCSFSKINPRRISRPLARGAQTPA
jgi:hypothetical protein